MNHPRALQLLTIKKYAIRHWFVGNSAIAHSVHVIETLLLHTQLVENMLSACLANLEYGQNICPELDSSSLMRGRSGCLVHKMNTESVEGSLIDSEQKIEVNSHYLHELF